MKKQNVKKTKVLKKNKKKQPNLGFLLLLIGIVLCVLLFSFYSVNNTETYSIQLEFNVPEAASNQTYPGLRDIYMQYRKNIIDMYYIKVNDTVESYQMEGNELKYFIYFTLEFPSDAYNLYVYVRFNVTIANFTILANGFTIDNELCPISDAHLEENDYCIFLIGRSTGIWNVEIEIPIKSKEE